MEKPFFVQILGSRAELLVQPVTDLGCRSEVVASPEHLSPQADICLAWGVYSLIRPSFLRVPRLGLWGFHESPLPKGRGCAPLQWTVLNGEDRLSVSFFQLAEKMDAGPLLAQASCPLLSTDLLEDMRRKVLDMVKDLLQKNLLPFLRGEIQPQEQRGAPTFFRKRTSEDSRLDPAQTLAELWDLIRVCDNDSFPAWFEIGGQRFILKRFRAEKKG
jgi:methionyl-tRNA formyltransferase